MNTAYVYVLVSVNCGIKSTHSIHSTLDKAQNEFGRISDFLPQNRYYIKKVELDNAEVDIHAEDD